MDKEELGAENDRIRKQLRDAEILASYSGGCRLDSVKILEAPSEWHEVAENAKRANSRQIAGTHYKDMDIQPWDIIDQGNREQAIGFYRYNALKYVMRAGDKDPFKQDIAKAHHYLEKLLEILE